MRKSFVLSTGRTCRVDNPGLPLLADYHVLHFPPGQGGSAEGTPTEEEVEEMLVLARRLARRLGAEHHGDPECYTVLFNGVRTSRRPWVHFHLLPAKSVAGKRWALLCLLAKRWLRLASSPGRGLAWSGARRSAWS
jgi:diadenosine tetraphosphate (Ap4A) HIT family hydrolase